MGDMGDTFRVMQEDSKQRRAINRERTAEMLREHGIEFVSKNGGAHLIVDGKWSIWPGTGKWKHHNLPQAGRGVRGLLRAMKGE